MSRIEMPPRPKLLCVDDEAPVVDALTRLLRHDFDILLANSGADGLKQLQQNPDCAVIISDQTMPDMKGIEFLSRTKAIAPMAVRAILSGHIDLEQMMLAINSAEIHRFILKPWDNDYLRLQMLEAVKIHGLLAEKTYLQQLSVTDPLTQLPNHRYFQDHIKREADRASRHNRPLTLIMADVDYFKKINDQYGHPEGDQILVSVATRLNEQVRSIDSVCRYGGEEFAIILPDTPLTPACEVAERIRKAFADKPCQGIEQKINVTVSFGVASIPDHAKNAKDLIRMADQALYKAKNSGRNRVELA